MKSVYAIRDRMLDYFMNHFIAGDNPKVILSSIADTINDGASKHAISQTPTHFEVWQLATIDEETGHVKPEPKFIAECASLVRGNIRPEPAGRNETLHGAPGSQQGPTGKTAGNGSANLVTPPNAPQAAADAGGEAPQRHSGGAG